jgi:regulator of sirC expression with transglutaminase-like and TPR domain
MQENKELDALFQLIDDPDEEVFGAVSNRIVDYGSVIIPNLENLWENSVCNDVQNRIELLIHRLHYSDLSEEFRRWNEQTHPELLQGAILLCKYKYPELSTTQVYQDIEKLRRNIWLELNSYLTPLEQVNVLTSILYNYFNLRGEESNYQQPDDFLLHKVLETKKGNCISNGILYVILSELLDLPIRVVNIPKQFVLGYFRTDYDFSRHKDNITYKAEFFIDPVSGHIFTHKEVEAYFKRIQLTSCEHFYKQVSNRKTIQLMIEEYGKCFDNEKNKAQFNELKSLASIITPS